MASLVRVASVVPAPLRPFAAHLVPLAQIAVLTAFGLGLARIVAALHIVVPAPGIGIALLVALFALRFARSESLEPGASFLARHLGVFFVPILGGTALTWRVPAHVLLPVLATLALSATCAFVTTGLIFELGLRAKR